jgi:restriction endonuclease EcoRII-like protein
VNQPDRIAKTLSANDIGDTGGHQAGILIPKISEILSFFPRLDPREKNPRVRLVFRDDDQITRWEFAFIYYNNRFFGGTRNEHRLTCMTKYLRSKNAKVGDDLVFTRDEAGRLFVRCSRANQIETEDDILVLSGGWKIVSTK